MLSNFGRSAIKLLIFTAVLVALNLLLVKSEIVSRSFIAISHVFFFSVNLLLIFLFDLIARINIGRAGFVFIAFMFVKILLIVLLLSILSRSTPLHKWLMLNFSVAYLANLFFSIYLCLKTLNYYQK